MTSPHFTDAELRCPCCGVNGMQQAALDLAEEVRSKAEDHFGLGRVRLGVNSGYRCEDHNKAIGGSVRSQHVRGLALDLVLQIAQERGRGKTEWVRVNPRVFEQIARCSPKLGGIGPDDQRGFVHIDARPKLSALPAQWCYHNGKEVAYYKVVDSTQRTT